MSAITGRVVRKAPSLTKSEVKPLVAAGLARAVAAHGIERVALHGGCTTRCIQKAIAGDTLPELHTALNVAALDLDATADVMTAYGLGVFLLEPDTLPDADALASLAALLAEVAEGMRDGRLDHVETCRVAAKASPVAPWINGVIARAVKVRGAGK